MNWLEVTQNLFTVLIGSGVIGFFSKELFKYYLDKSIDKYHLQLNKETESFKHQLQLITQEHQIQYLKLHSDRVEVIKLLYQKLVMLEKAMCSYMARYKLIDSFNNEEEKQKLASESAKDFFDYFHLNEIFFDESICSLIKEMDELYSDAWNKYTFHDTKIAHQIATEDQNYRIERVEDLKNVWDAITKKISPIKKKLENQFRDLLGVKNMNSNIHHLPSQNP